MSETTRRTLHRYLEGLSGVSADDPLAAFNGGLDPAKWAIWMEDFLFYDVAQGDAGWIFTQTNCTDTVVGPTGVLTLTNANADTDLGQLYPSSGVWQTNSKKLLWECKCKVNSVTLGQEAAFIGLSSIHTGTNFIDAAMTARAMDDAMGFITYDGNTNWTALQGENDTFSQEVDVIALEDDTFIQLGCYFNGSITKFYKDRALVATLTTNEPTSVLTPMMFVKAGAAEGQILSVDYFWLAAER